MATSSQSKYSPSFGSAVQGFSIDNNRRLFDFGSRIAELAPQQSPFFVYLSKVAKKPTNDPVFKFLEQRHQWQRRNFEVSTALSNLDKDGGVAFGAGNDLVIKCGYNNKGVIEADQPCKFIVPGDVLTLATNEGTVTVQIKDTAVIGTVAGTEGEIVHGASSTTIAGEDVVVVGPDMSSTEDILAGAKGQVIGSAWGEGTTAPLGWEDAMHDREGYCQIFKTAMNLFSNTARATEYRGIKNEYQRIWSEKLMEHKMDLEQAFLFGRGAGGMTLAGDSGGTVPNPEANTKRYTHGIVPFTEVNGKVYNMSYASSGYDGSFLNNSVGSSQYRMDAQNVKGSFGHNVTMINTIFGNLHFVAEPLLRGPWENYAMCVDMKNVAYRPLVGNGMSRDTYIETNIQGNDEDGRRDLILTEAGLEVSLPETHAVLKFS